MSNEHKAPPIGCKSRLIAAYRNYMLYVAPVGTKQPAPAFKAGDRARHKEGQTGSFYSCLPVADALQFVSDTGITISGLFSDLTPLPPLPAGFKPMATAPTGKPIILATGLAPIGVCGEWDHEREQWKLEPEQYGWIDTDDCLGWQDFPKVEIPKD